MNGFLAHLRPDIGGMGVLGGVRDVTLDWVGVKVDRPGSGVRGGVIGNMVGFNVDLPGSAGLSVVGMVVVVGCVSDVGLGVVIVDWLGLLVVIGGCITVEVVGVD